MGRLLANIGHDTYYAQHWIKIHKGTGPKSVPKRVRMNTTNQRILAPYRMRALRCEL